MMMNLRFDRSLSLIIMAASLICLQAPDSSRADDACGPLGAPLENETVVTVSDTASIQDEIDSADGPKTIFLEDGMYTVTTESWIMVTNPDITIRSLSGNRDAVIIQGPGMSASGGFGIQVYDSRVTIADITIRDVGFHPIQVSKTDGKQTDGLLFHNIRCIDAGQQLFKSSGGDMYDSIIECSTFEYTTTLDEGNYTNGIDLVGTHNWTIRDNTIRNIKAAEGLAGPAILIWPAGTGMVSSDTLVERNRILDCDMGIFFGNSSDSALNHTGGIIRNNFIKGYSGSDAGIGLVRAANATVANNTVFSPGGLVDWSIETRFSETTGCTIINNLTDEQILERNGGTATQISNFDGAVEDDFVNAEDGDLHLVSRDNTAVVDAGTLTDARETDIDGETVQDSKVDIGADEYSAYKVYIPHITESAADWTDYLQITNNDTSTASFELDLYSNGAKALSERYSVDGLSTSIIELKALSPSAQTGIIRYANQGLTFRFSTENDGGGIAEFLLQASLYSTAGLYFSDFTPNIVVKGAVIANMTDTPAEVTLYAIGDGKVLDRLSVTIDPFEKRVGTHDAWFPDVSFAEIRHIIAATTASSMSGFVISGNATLSDLLFTPAAPLPDTIQESLETK